MNKRCKCLFALPVCHPSLRRKLCIFWGFSRRLKKSSLVLSPATLHWCGTQTSRLLLFKKKIERVRRSAVSAFSSQVVQTNQRQLPSARLLLYSVQTTRKAQDSRRNRRVSWSTQRCYSYRCAAWVIKLVLLFSWRSSDETDTRPEGRVHGLHLPLSEPLLLPRGVRSHAAQSSKGVQVTPRHSS